VDVHLYDNRSDLFGISLKVEQKTNVDRFDDWPVIVIPTARVLNGRNKSEDLLHRNTQGGHCPYIRKQRVQCRQFGRKRISRERSWQADNLPTSLNFHDCVEPAQRTSLHHPISTPTLTTLSTKCPHLTLQQHPVTVVPIGWRH